MSIARQIANFDPALFDADEVSGDKVSGGTIGAGVIGASVTGGAGLSGMTSLGTVTTGTYNSTIGSSATFPSGHVVQIVNNVYSAESSDQVVNTDGFTRVVKSGSYDWGATINNVGASNHVMIIASFQGNYYKDSFTGSDDNNAGGFGFFRESTAILTAHNAANYFHIDSGVTNYLNIDRQHTITFIDESPATGTNNYYLGYIVCPYRSCWLLFRLYSWRTSNKSEC